MDRADGAFAALAVAIEEHFSPDQCARRVEGVQRARPDQAAPSANVPVNDNRAVTILGDMNMRVQQGTTLPKVDDDEGARTRRRSDS